MVDRHDLAWAGSMQPAVQGTAANRERTEPDTETNIEPARRTSRRARRDGVWRTAWIWMSDDDGGGGGRGEDLPKPLLACYMKELQDRGCEFPVCEEGG